MPKVISRKNKRSVTYRENAKVLAWLERIARERKVAVAVIIREATSDYYVRDKERASAPTLTEQRAAAKRAARAETVRKIASGELTPEQAQWRNAPIRGRVEIVDLQAALRRLSRTRKKRAE